MDTILVTGASGNVGSRVVRGLLAKEPRDVKVRAFVRKSERSSFDEKVERAVGDFGDAASVRKALEGVTKVYLLSTGPALARQEATVIDAAIEAGVAHVVKHSVAGAQFEACAIPRWHREGEKRLEASSVKWTFLRPASFMTNAMGWAQSIKGQGKVYDPMGDASLPVIDPADIADVAVKALTSAGHEGKAYDLTGPDSLSTTQQAAILSEAIKKPLEVVPVNAAAARDAMLGMGMEAAWVDAMVELIVFLQGLKRIEANDTVKTVLGRPAKSFQAWAQSNAGAFR